MRQLAIVLTSIVLVAGFTGGASAQVASPAQPAAEATLMVWNRPVVVFRSAIGARSPADRVRDATARIAALRPSSLTGAVRAEAGTAGAFTGMLVFVDSVIVFGIVPTDVDPLSNDSLETVGREAADALREALAARASDRSLTALLRNLGLTLLLTVVLATAIWLIVRVRQWIVMRWLAPAPRRRFALLELNLWPYLAEVLRALIGALSWIAALAASIVWIGLVFSLFPYTQPWASALAGRLSRIVIDLLHAAVNAAPGLTAAVIIFAFARLLTRLVSGAFDRIADRSLRLPWLDAETARPTKRLATTLVWVFAAVAAYPYIPGSESDAFKGIGVFIGLVFSLGSAGMMNQVLSGLVVTYSRAFRPAEFVRVGDVEGVVTDVGVLATRVVTVRQEEIIIPHAVAIGSPTTNYSRLAPATGGARVETGLTVGYNVPWRQVRELLLIACDRTTGVLKSPEPIVRHHALSTLSVEYRLIVTIERAQDRLSMLSALHGNILDTFNEFGVQIMVPQFEAQPEEPVVVPPAHWFTPPARKTGTLP